MNFKDLQAWQLAIDLVEEIYVLTRSFPQSELYGLTSQMRRSAISIPSNLAEGNGRDSTKEYLHFIAIAYGSLCELETQLVIAKKLNFIPETIDLEILSGKLTRTAKTTRALQSSLKRKLGAGVGG